MLVSAAILAVLTTQALGALAHFEDDPHTALWVADHIPAVFLVDWWRNRWLKAERVHRIEWIAEAGAILRTIEDRPGDSFSQARPPS